MLPKVLPHRAVAKAQLYGAMAAATVAEPAVVRPLLQSLDAFLAASAAASTAGGEGELAAAQEARLATRVRELLGSLGVAS